MKRKGTTDIFIRMVLILSITPLSACTAPFLHYSPTPTTLPTPSATSEYVDTASPLVVATAFLAVLIGKLNIVEGCVRVIDRVDHASRLLVWPPDFEVTIEKDTVRVVGGKVTGNHTEVLLHDGEYVRLSGGEISLPNEQLLSSEPSNCPGPYWVVGFNVEPYPGINETSP